MTFWGDGTDGTDRQTDIWTDRLFSGNIILDKITFSILCLIIVERYLSTLYQKSCPRMYTNLIKERQI